MWNNSKTSTKSIFSLSFSVSYSLRTVLQNFDVPCGPITPYSAVLWPIGESSTIEK